MVINMNSEDYIISITGRQQYGAENDDGEISINTLGTYTKQGRSRVITYMEFDEGNPSRSQCSTLQIEGSRVTMSKQDSSTRLILEKGKRHLCIYETDFGPMTIGIFTSSLSSSLNDSGGELSIKYTMDIESSFSSQNEINITVKPQSPVKINQ